MSRRSRWFLVLGGFFVLFVVVGALLVLSVAGGPSIPRRSVLWVSLGGEIPETDRRSPIERLLLRRVPTVIERLGVLEAAAADRRIAAAVVELKGFGGGWAKADEIREALVAFRKSGKPLVAFLESGETKDYLVATAGERIVMPPSGVLLVNGLLADVPFYKGTLDKLGVHADLEHIGAYKGASETYTRDSMSDAGREAMSLVLDGLYGRLVSVVAGARSLPRDRVTQAFDEGFLTAARGKELGLVDDLLYRDQLEDELAEKAGGELRTVTESTYLATLGGKAGGPRLAVIHIDGVIASGRSATDALGNASTGSETVARALRSAREDDGIRALILRVDSPGGSGLASDVIWREVELTRKAKPVVVSMSDLAASGGYYVAMGADAIVAGENTLTGSIGVISGKFSLRGLYDWIGLKREQIKRGENADIFTDYRPFTEGQRAILVRQMESFYADFVHKAASGRKKSDAEIDAIGQGRVWTGGQARERGLVDETGGFARALEIAKKKAGIPAGRSVTLVELPAARGLFESLTSQDGDEALGRGVVRALLPAPLRKAASDLGVVDRVAGEFYLYLDPRLLGSR